MLGVVFHSLETNDCSNVLKVVEGTISGIFIFDIEQFKMKVYFNLYSSHSNYNFDCSVQVQQKVLPRR